MKIVLTGSSGRIGAHVLKHFVAQGHQVLAVDRIVNPSGHRPSWVCDLNQSGDLFEAFAGADAVVHLAAVPAANKMSDCTTFANNTASTYNVLKAAAVSKVRKIVLASSIAAYGFFYAKTMPMPDYLPLDEDHPSRPTDSYGLSKTVGESIADSFARETGASIASFRLPDLNYDPEFKLLKQEMADPKSHLDGFWAYIDVRDAAQACLDALNTDLGGHQVFNIAAPTSNMREATDALLAKYLPGVKKQRADLAGNWSGMDCRKAERMIGFRPQYFWEKV